ncbi:hypothetical protein DFH09DRAFT_1133946 [Mycena vulgaris]|nr:hypothetical protein DFH09DRAFT_1133946 [Mycena vulgaris]
MDIILIRPPFPPPVIQRPPIHELSLIVNPQDHSPLYNGRIPPEIRNAIFEFVLAEYTKPDPASAYRQSLCRPGYTGARAINVAFLLVCRRVYLETYHLPVAAKEHVFWHRPQTGPYGFQFPDIHGIAHETQYFARFQAWQVALVKEIHLFTQMFWLEQSFASFCGAEFTQGIEKIKITLRKGDWWYNAHNQPLFINPHKTVRSGHWDAARAQIAREERGEVIPWDESGWGSAFKKLQALKELEMEFEMTMDKREEMRIIVNRALTWRFPMGERSVLSNEGLGMELSQWQGEKDLFCVFVVKWKLVSR